MISFYILSKRSHLKRKGLFDARVVSMTKKIQGSAIYLSRYLVNDQLQFAKNLFSAGFS